MGPEEIVEAAEPSSAPHEPRAGALEIVALIALLLPVLGWLVGTVLALASQVWSRRDKLTGVLLLLVVPVVLACLSLIASPEVLPAEEGAVGEQVEGLVLGPVETVVLLVMSPALPSALYLAWRLRRNRVSSPADS